jgi:hypothetical protein
VLGIRTTGKGAASPQPFVGIVDCGASFSAVNWAAARLLGLLEPNGDLKGKRGPDIMSLGVDGRPVPYPTTSVSFTFAGEGARSQHSKHIQCVALFCVLVLGQLQPVCTAPMLTVAVTRQCLC